MRRRVEERNMDLKVGTATRVVLAVAIVVLSLATPGARGDESGAGADGYGIGRPVPRGEMRPLSADRPDATESPYTVDAGHWQFEVSFLEYARENDGADVDAWTLLNSNVKLGVTDDIDLQLVFAVYSEVEIDPPGPAFQEVEGFSDVTLRVKINLWGNDGGPTAFGLMPFVKIPTRTDLSNDEYEGGLIATLGWSAAETWGLGLMAEADVVYDPADNDHDMEFLHTAVIGFDLPGPYGGYCEYVGVASSDGDSDYRASLSAGATYQLSPDLQLDAGLRIGLNEAAEDLLLFTGITARY